MMGLNAAARLNALGLGVKKSDILRLPLHDFRIVKSGPTKHPRAHLPPRPALVEYIKEHGIPCSERRYSGREDGDRIELIDGCCRTVAGLVAQKWLQENRPAAFPLERDKRNPDGPWVLYAEVELVEAEGIDLMLARLDANVSRGEPDSAGVLASVVKGIVKLNKGEPDAALMARIVAVMPRGVTSGVVSALSLWDNLAAELQARFDSGEAPIGLLVPVMAARSDERAALLDRLLARGVRTAKGATRAVNKARDAADPWSRRMSPSGLRKVADAIEGVNREARLVALGMRLAGSSGKDAKVALKALPATVHAAIEAARAEPGKAVRS